MSHKHGVDLLLLPMEKYNPFPWKLPLRADPRDDGSCRILDNDGDEVYPDMDEDRAESFLRAVNDYSTLVESARDLLDRMARYEPSGGEPLRTALTFAASDRWCSRVQKGQVVRRAGHPDEFLVTDARLAPGDAWVACLVPLRNGVPDRTTCQTVHQTGPDAERLLITGRMENRWVRTE